MNTKQWKTMKRNPKSLKMVLGSTIAKLVATPDDKVMAMITGADGTKIYKQSKQLTIQELATVLEFGGYKIVDVDNMLELRK